MKWSFLLINSGVAFKNLLQNVIHFVKFSTHFGMVWSITMAAVIYTQEMTY